MAEKTKTLEEQYPRLADQIAQGRFAAQAAGYSDEEYDQAMDQAISKAMYSKQQKYIEKEKLSPNAAAQKLMGKLGIDPNPAQVIDAEADKTPKERPLVNVLRTVGKQAEAGLAAAYRVPIGVGSAIAGKPVYSMEDVIGPVGTAAMEGLETISQPIARGVGKGAAALSRAAQPTPEQLAQINAERVAKGYEPYPEDMGALPPPEVMEALGFKAGAMATFAPEYPSQASADAQDLSAALGLEPPPDESVIEDEFGLLGGAAVETAAELAGAFFPADVALSAAGDTAQQLTKQAARNSDLARQARLAAADPALAEADELIQRAAADVPERHGLKPTAMATPAGRSVTPNLGAQSALERAQQESGLAFREALAREGLPEGVSPAGAPDMGMEDAAAEFQRILDQVDEADRAQFIDDVLKDLDVESPPLMRKPLRGTKQAFDRAPAGTRIAEGAERGQVRPLNVGEPGARPYSLEQDPSARGLADDATPASPTSPEVRAIEEDQMLRDLEDDLLLRREMARIRADAGSRPIQEVQADLTKLAEREAQRLRARDLSPDEIEQMLNKAMGGKFRALIGPDDFDEIIQSAARGISKFGRGRGGAGHEIARWVRNFLTTDQALAADRSGLLGRISDKIIDATQRGKALRDIPEEVQRAVSRIADGELRIDSLPAAMRSAVEKAQADLLPLLEIIKGQEKKINELLGTEFNKAALGEYFRRVYFSRLVPDWKPSAEVVEDAIQWVTSNVERDGKLLTRSEAQDLLSDVRAGKARADVGVRGLRETSAMFASPLKARQKIPKPIRQFMGEVENATHRAMLTIADQARVIEHAEFYRKIAAQAKSGELAKRVPDEMVVLKDYVGNRLRLNYGVDQKKILGDLWNTEIPRAVADEIVDMHATMDTLNEFFAGGMGLLKRKYTAYNPSTHFNNVIGNVFFSALAGNPLSNYKSYGKALSELVSAARGNPGELYREAVRAGVLKGTFFDQGDKLLVRFAEELAAEASDSPAGLLRAWDRAKSSLKGIDTAVTGLYDAEDQWFKLAAYINARSGNLRKPRFTLNKRVAGMIADAAKPGDAGIKAAADYVNHFFPNYDWLGLSTKGARRNILSQALGNPFVAFPMEAMRVGYNAASTVPLSMGLMLGGLGTVSAYGTMVMGPSPEEVAEWRKGLPSYQRERLMIPYRTPSGDIDGFDLTYRFPLAEVIFGYRPDLTRSDMQIPDRAFHAAVGTFGGGWLTRDFSKPSGGTALDEAKQRFVGKGGVTGLVRPEGGGGLADPLPPSIRRAWRAAVADDKNYYGEPEPTVGQALTGFVPVRGDSKRENIEKKRLKSEIQRDFNVEKKDDGDAARERKRERKKALRENF